MRIRNQLKATLFSQMLNKNKKTPKFMISFESLSFVNDPESSFENNNSKDNI
jgi:hypothetical protein